MRWYVTWRVRGMAALLAALMAMSPRLDAQGRPPADSTPVRLAASTWPIYHADTRASAASPRVGPGTLERVERVDALSSRRVRRPAVSPWTVLDAPYPDGAQAVLTTPNDGVAKYLITGDRLLAVDFLPLERRDRDFDWGILLLDGHRGVVTERRHNRFVIFGDAGPGPRAKLEVKARIPIDAGRHGELTAHFSLAPDGRLIALTSGNRLIAVDLQRRAVVAAFDLPAGSGTSFHNSFPIDERGRIFLAAQERVLAIDWTGDAFQVAWSARYDMRGPGCDRVPAERSRRREAMDVARGARCTGSGTTPTLVGGREGGVVVLVDGHAPRNNLVAFWQDTPPADWTPLPDPLRRGGRLDRQVAGVLSLPHSSPEGDGFTAENSPAALGNAVVVAQWAGFRPSADAPRGVQRVDWDPARRSLVLAWAAPDVHFNGVPTIACERPGLCHAYGMGWHDGRYQYTAIALATGEVAGRLDLGTDDAVLDQGNSHAVAADGSIVYAGRTLLLRVR